MGSDHITFPISTVLNKELTIKGSFRCGFLYHISSHHLTLFVARFIAATDPDATKSRSTSSPAERSILAPSSLTGTATRVTTHGC